jgi:hypothetical protein
LLFYSGSEDNKFFTADKCSAPRLSAQQAVFAAKAAKHFKSTELPVCGK